MHRIFVFYQLLKEQEKTVLLWTLTISFQKLSMSKSDRVPASYPYEMLLQRAANESRQKSLFSVATFLNLQTVLLANCLSQSFWFCAEIQQVDQRVTGHPITMNKINYCSLYAFIRKMQQVAFFFNATCFEYFFTWRKKRIHDLSVFFCTD